MPKIPTLSTVDLRAATRQLSTVDPALGRVIQRVGPFEPDWRFDKSPYEGLFRSIVYQQLSGKAAGTIFNRVCAACGDGKIPAPHLVAPIADHVLRGAGLSQNKMLAIRDLAARTLDGTVPDRTTARKTPDEVLIERLVAVRGVGRWSAEMLLMFGLGRTDVFPTSDLGIRKGFQLTYGMKRMPAEVTMVRQAKRWAPYRTIASWYLWRVLDL
jgi:3-methyladenine DNA glycosylase/8-oxoguanine DNA glycosylase